MSSTAPRQFVIDWNWRIDAAIFVVMGFTALWNGFWFYDATRFLLGMGFAIATWLARKYAGLALTMFWPLALLTLLHSPIPLVPEVLSAFWIAYCASRWGTQASLITAGVSGLLGGAFVTIVASGMYDPYISLLSGLVAAGGIAVPWALGLRSRAVETSQADRARAVAAEERHQIAAAALAQAEAEEERLSRVAELEAANAQLARDVHDVVGHSLAVILAQSEAAQFLTEPEQLHNSMANIAGSARRSLGEIREVLSHARGEGGGGDGDLDQLVASLRASGVDVVEQSDGLPRALPPELEQVAYRVLQEMLTNAIRHGAPGERIVVARTWTDRLMLQVRNLAGAKKAKPERYLGGAGIPGMRSRLEAVGGSFELLRHDGERGQVVIATAWLPTRAQR